MNPLRSPLLADENIHPEVISFLRSQGTIVESVVEIGLQGYADRAILNYAIERDLIILTHDSDFGTLVITEDSPIVGIVFVRPGHILPSFTIATLKTILAQSLEVRPPFIIVARRVGNQVNIRTRYL